MSDGASPLDVLLIDPRGDRRAQRRALLEGPGRTVWSAGSVQEAEEFLERDIGLFLLGMDGTDSEPDAVDLAERLRAHPRHDGVGILFLARPEPDRMARLRARGGGPVDWMEEGWTPAMLQSRVDLFAAYYRVAWRAPGPGIPGDDILAVLGHELRTPLTALAACAEVLRGDSLPEVQRHQAGERLVRQVQHMTRLVEDLVESSRLDRGGLVLDRARVDLRTITFEAVETVRPFLDGANHSLLVVVPPEPAWVWGDAGRLRQVVINLLHNAAKFTPPGGEVRVELHEAPGEVVLEVTDTGVGIPPEGLPLLFAPFARRGATVGPSAGLGIGLSLVRRLVELHGGTVGALSEGPGQGTTLRIRLPGQSPVARFATSHAHGATSQERPAFAMTGRDGLEALERRRILVVDDDRDAADAIGLLLQARGHHVRLAYQGLEAFHAVRSFVPDVVLLDLGLRGMDGYEVARRLRAEPWGRGLLLVAVTGWAQEEDRARTRDAGFDVHLVKPVGELDLVRALRVDPRLSAR